MEDTIRVFVSILVSDESNAANVVLEGSVYTWQFTGCIADLGEASRY